MLKLITETIYGLELLESKSDKDLYVVGIFSSAEQKNQNGRIYKKATLEREVNRINEEYFKTGKPLFGTLGHPSSPETDLPDVALRTVALEWRGNDLYGKAKILKELPKGSIAAALLKESKMIGISSRGLGEVSNDNYVNDESYTLLTYDIVSNPSNSSSWVNGIYEGAIFNSYENVEDELELLRRKHFDKITNMLQRIKGR
jgi:hypothetical protein